MIFRPQHVPDRTTDSDGRLVGKTGDRFALPILIICLLFALCQLAFNALTLDTWMDEGKYLMKGYWYLTGQVPPYSAIDPTFYMPLPFYSVGAMEWLFGIGYLPGRALAIFFAIACLVLVYLTGTRIGQSRLAGTGAAVLVAGYPVTLTYFATATPYALVSCLSLALILVLLAVRTRWIAWGLSGIILWALLFTRPNMLPIAMLPAAWALLIEPRRKIECLAVAVVTFLAASLATLWVFGNGLLEVVLDVPGLSQIASLLGAPPAPISKILPLTVSPLDPVLSLREVPTYFYLYFFRPYFAVSAMTLAVVALRILSAWRGPGERRIKPIDLILVYFWTATLLHYLLSLSYCVDCIIPYTNYFLPVGALGVAALLGEISRLTLNSRPVFAAFICVCVMAVVMHASPSFPTLLRPKTDLVRTAATELAAQLRPILPPTGRVLVLSDRVEAAQAVWLAGGVIEARSLYLPTNYREPKPGVTPEDRAKIDAITWEAGFWNEDNMRRALDRDYRTLLVERRASYGDVLARTVRDGIPFGDVVARRFSLASVAKVGDRTFELYQRRD
ncbi:hypothetical protein JQ621_33740 [Bradyrhizobium manausense]|uniref:hypothetical protein n=1 Tax=Bradyrhizobium manausense TaxID=989370 RepID=UPI001BA72072|nr:hypothetical protein [Bradyrhizobium manausense]MBR1092434.1 hypothetical protein [Bradyrhizobium manausense]